MAATRGTLSTERSHVTRLGHHFTEARADTWRTFVTAHVAKDGSVRVTVTRDGQTVHSFVLGPEGARPEIQPYAYTSGIPRA
jgi:hypothetical protein